MGGAGGTCRADADKDGVVSRAEAEKMGPQALSRFDAADTNKDGKLDAAEMAARCGARPS